MGRMHDDELFAMVQKELFTCVVGDVMDKMRLFHQYLPPQIRPLREDMILIGRAMPVLSGDVYEESISESRGPLSSKSFGLMLEALDDLRRNEIYLSAGSSPRNAMWGEMMTIRAQKLGARGAVTNGHVRDVKGIMSRNFPTFCYGPYGQDSAPRYKVYDFRIPIEVGGVRIEPGDILYGDIDGVLVIPAVHEEEVLRRALEKARGEKTVQRALEQGVSAVQAFADHGIM